MSNCLISNCFARVSCRSDPMAAEKSCLLKPSDRKQILLSLRDAQKEYPGRLPFEDLWANTSEQND